MIRSRSLPLGRKSGLGSICSELTIAGWEAGERVAGRAVAGVCCSSGSTLALLVASPSSSSSEYSSTSAFRKFRPAACAGIGEEPEDTRVEGPIPSMVGLRRDGVGLWERACCCCCTDSSASMVEARRRLMSSGLVPIFLRPRASHMERSLGTFMPWRSRMLYSSCSPRSAPAPTTIWSLTSLPCLSIPATTSRWSLELSSSLPSVNEYSTFSPPAQPSVWSSLRCMLSPCCCILYPGSRRITRLLLWNAPNPPMLWKVATALDARPECPRMGSRELL
mmetsp:Transcript_55394/g.130549  ORF Transcript_55394/g.130549 Transcript_55394/m.130549 type:complete len:278 (-) Transcript_55394:498-1331(-)